MTKRIAIAGKPKAELPWKQNHYGNYTGGQKALKSWTNSAFIWVEYQGQKHPGNKNHKPTIF